MQDTITLHDFIFGDSLPNYTIFVSNFFTLHDSASAELTFFTLHDRLLHIVMDWDRARRRGPHQTDQSEKIASLPVQKINYRHPPNCITLFVPTSINYELHEISLHFFDSLRIICVIFILPAVFLRRRRSRSADIRAASVACE